MQGSFASPFSSMLQAAVVAALSALCEEFYQAEPGQADIQMQGEWNFIPSFDQFHFASGIKSVSLSTHTQTSWFLTTLTSWRVTRWQPVVAQPLLSGVCLDFWSVEKWNRYGERIHSFIIVVSFGLILCVLIRSNACFPVIDPGSSAAGKHHQREGWHLYRGEERCCQSCCSVSVCSYYHFISLGLASTVYLQAVAALVNLMNFYLILHQSVRKSRCVCPWIPRHRPVPREYSRGVWLSAQQLERLHGRQQRRRRSLVS